MADVFISYSRQNKAYVEKLALHLTAAGIDVWFDHEIVSGDRWERVIEKQIEACAAMVVVMSPAANDSVMVANEVDLARARGKVIAPVLLDGEPFFGLRHMHYEDARDAALPAPAFVDRLRALRPPDVSSSRSSAPSPGTPKLARVLTGHNGWVYSVAWSPADTLLATAGTDGTARVWPNGEREPVTLRGHHGPVFQVAWSPTGTRLATAGYDRKTMIWSPDLATPVRVLEGPMREVNAVAWSRDGAQVAAVGAHNPWRWNADTGLGDRITIARSGDLFAVAWSPSGRHLAVAGFAGHLVTCDVETFATASVCDGHKGDVLAVDWAPDGRRLASAGSDATVRVWDAESGRAIAVLQEGPDPVRSVAWSTDGTTIATAHDDGGVRIWHAVSGAVLYVVAGHSGPVTSVAWSRDSRRLATAGADQTARVWTMYND